MTESHVIAAGVYMLLGFSVAHAFVGCDWRGNQPVAVDASSDVVDAGDEPEAAPAPDVVDEPEGAPFGPGNTGCNGIGCGGGGTGGGPGAGGGHGMM